LQQEQVSAQYDLLLQHNNGLLSFVPELMDLLLTGEDQSQADQPNRMAEGPPMKTKRKDSAGSDDSASMIKGGGFVGVRTSNPPPCKHTKKISVGQGDCVPCNSDHN